MLTRANFGTGYCHPALPFRATGSETRRIKIQGTSGSPRLYPPRPLELRLGGDLQALISANYGAPTTIRTPDLLITNQLLYQLSYKGKTLVETDLDLRGSIMRPTKLEGWCCVHRPRQATPSRTRYGVP